MLYIYMRFRKNMKTVKNFGQKFSAKNAAQKFGRRYIAAMLVGLLVAAMAIPAFAAGEATDLGFFNKAVDVLKYLVFAIGAGLCIWGVINLLEGYGNDNRARCSCSGYACIA